MTDFHFESYFTSCMPVFVKKVKEQSPELGAAITLSPELKQFFKPTVEEKKQIIEDFLKWAYDEGLDTTISGCHLRYIEKLKREEKS